MRSIDPCARVRGRRFGLLVGACVALLAFVPAAAVADGGEDLASSGGDVATAPPADLGDVSGGASLLPEEGGDPFAGDTAPEAGEGEGDAARPTDDLTGTKAELELRRAALRRQRDTLQAQLLELETSRGAAEDRLERAESAYADHLVWLYDEDALDRVEALIALRDVGDQAQRETLVSALVDADRAVVTAQDTARAAVTTAAERVESTRAELERLAARITAFDEAIDGRRARTAARHGTYSIDPDLVFATGAIPGIGYWGAVNDGSLLQGWMGYAGASLGGIGCESPDPSLHGTGTIEQGEASWYGPGFDGERAASGETYDQTALTAAHRTLPFGTIVRVYSQATARCVFVRINDRGPFVDGRVIDLSRAAADAIGMESVAPVQLEVWAGDQ